MAESVTPFPSRDPGSRAPGRVAEPPLKLGDWVFEPALNRLTSESETIRLEPIVAALLELLTARHGQVVSKDEIVDIVWEGRFVADSALTRAMAELRRALGDDAQEPRYIETISKKGYRLLVEPEPVGPTLEKAAKPATRPAALALAALGLALVTWLLLQELRSVPRPPTPPAVAAVIVLPLEDRSGEWETEYFATAMTDALTNDLARAGAFRVLSRRSIEQYEQDHGDLGGVAQALGADAAVEGSIVRADGRVRINVQLTDAATETHLWARSYEREFSDVLGLQNEVAAAIVAELTDSVTQAPTGDEPAKVDPDAHDIYLQARHALKRARHTGPNEAGELLDRAITGAPDFAPAYAARAHYYTMLTLFDFLRPHDGFPRARADALQALELDGQLAEAHAVLAHVEFLFDWDWEKADAGFRRALELNPSNARNENAYSFFLTCMGRFDDALDHARREIELDPLNAGSHLGWVLFNARRYEESIAALQGTGVEEHGGSKAVVGWNYAMLGRHDEAIAILEAVLDKRDYADPVTIGILGWTLAASGRPEPARRQLERLEALAEESRADLYPRVVVHAGLGEVDLALDLLEQAVLQRSPNAVFLSVEPFLDPIRDHPRYQRLLANTRLSAENFD